MSWVERVERSKEVQLQGYRCTKREKMVSEWSLLQELAEVARAWFNWGPKGKISTQPVAEPWHCDHFSVDGHGSELQFFHVLPAFQQSWPWTTNINIPLSVPHKPRCHNLRMCNVMFASRRPMTFLTWGLILAHGEIKSDAKAYGASE